MKVVLYIMTTVTLMFAVDYETEIQPIFDNHCGNCHLGNSSGGLNLSSYEDVMQGANAGPVVIPGLHAVSSLYDRITRDNSEAGDMPPGNEELTSDQIDLIVQWIDEGALPEGETVDISGCMDPNALSCMEVIDPLYFPACSTCDNGIYDPNIVGGEAFCEWFMDAADEASGGCDSDCPWDIDEVLLYTASFCANCLASGTCNSMDPIILYNFNTEIFPDPPPCLLDCDFVDPIPCDNYYNSEATVDNGLCMYSDTPSQSEFEIIQTSSGYDLDWSDFIPPVDIIQYVLQRCLDPDGDTDGDGEFEYENCNMLVAPGSFYLESTYSDADEIVGQGGLSIKYTLYVHYPNNNYWGSAQNYYYAESECTLGDVSGDGMLNVLDIVNLVNYIFGVGDFTEDQLCAADLNADGIINVLDIVNLVNIILS